MYRTARATLCLQDQRWIVTLSGALELLQFGTELCYRLPSGPVRYSGDGQSFDRGQSWLVRRSAIDRRTGSGKIGHAMTLAGAWYVSPTFWTASGTVAVVVTGVVVAGITYMTWRKGSPIRRIGYRMSAVSLLQDVTGESARSLRTTWNDDPVAEPQLLRITLISQSRQDLGTDDGKPLEFRVNAKIIKIIRID